MPNPDRALSDEEAHRMDELIDKRIHRVPAAYLVNSRQFYGMDFYVDNRVLIPRPETEVLVEEAIKFGQEWRKNNQGVMNIADVGTGSGAIAVTLAANIPGSIVYATDISADALCVAEKNIRKYDFEGRIKLTKGYLLQQIIEKLHMVVANLPYIKESDLALLPPEISKYEPRAALDGGKCGTEMIQQLITQSAGKIAARRRLIARNRYWAGKGNNEDRGSQYTRSEGRVDQRPFRHKSSVENCTFEF